MNNNNTKNAVITGLVTKDAGNARHQVPTSFEVILPKSKRKVYFESGVYYCPVEKGDAITCYVSLTTLNEKECMALALERPLVIQQATRDNLIMSMTSASGKELGFKDCCIIVDTLITENDDDPASVYAWISDLSDKYHSSKANTVILDFIDGIDGAINISYNLKSKTATWISDFVKKILDWWFKSKNMRRLYLLGVDKKEIDESFLPHEILYKKLIDNPFTVPSISIEKAQLICKYIRRDVSDDMIKCGQILRSVHHNTISRQWTSTPNRHLIKEYPGIKNFLPTLQEDYGCSSEMSSMYLSTVLSIERTVANFIIERVKRDLITYTTPIGISVLDNSDDKILDVIDISTTNNNVDISTTNNDISDATPNVNNNNDEIDLHTHEETTNVKKRNRTPTNTTDVYVERVKVSIPDDVKLSDDQEIAIQGAVDHEVCIITGAAGTGKTTVIKHIVRNLRLRGLKFLLCSFTGKAVSRISEVTSNVASTIHSLINKSPEDIDRIVVDECSMVTTELFHSLITSYPDVDRVILIGDINQLPPMSWGAFFSQILTSECVPCYYLTTNHRVHTLDGIQDGIILNSNAIIRSVNDDFHFIPCSNFFIEEGGRNEVENIIKSIIDAGFDYKSIMILTPFKEVVTDLNKLAKSLYGIDRNNGITDSRGITWSEGDRIMVLHNDKDCGLYNGEEGYISEIFGDSVMAMFSKSKTCKILLDPKKSEKGGYNNTPKTVEEESMSVKKLTHSYAISVDKSQGSESDYVIFYLPHHRRSSFIHRNRIYTAITRAKVLCFVVGDIEGMELGVNKRVGYKYDNLGRMLKAELPEIGHKKNENRAINAVNTVINFDDEMPDDMFFDF